MTMACVQYCGSFLWHTTFEFFAALSSHSMIMASKKAGMLVKDISLPSEHLPHNWQPLNWNTENWFLCLWILCWWLITSIYLKNSELNYYVPRPKPESTKGAYTIEDLFCGTRFPQRLETTCLVLKNVFKPSFHGKDYLNTPWLIMTLIIKYVFVFLTLQLSSSLEYFRLILHTIPRKTM